MCVVDHSAGSSKPIVVEIVPVIVRGLYVLVQSWVCTSTVMGLYQYVTVLVQKLRKCRPSKSNAGRGHGFHNLLL
jgi:hypothetical protein